MAYDIDGASLCRSRVITYVENAKPNQPPKVACQGHQCIGRGKMPIGPKQKRQPSPYKPNGCNRLRDVDEVALAKSVPPT